MLHSTLPFLDGGVERNWPVWCVGSKRTIGNMSQKIYHRLLIRLHCGKCVIDLHDPISLES